MNDDDGCGDVGNLRESGILICVDLDPRAYNIDPAEVAKKVTEKTILVVR